MNSHLFFVALLVASAAAVTPVQKVVQMLGDMEAKSKAEMEDEQQRFKEFSKFCQGAAAAKVRSIEENTAVVGKLENEIGDLSDEVDELAAEISKADADMEVLAAKMAALDKKINSIGSEEEEITEERSKEHAIFEKSDTDYADSIDAMDRAIHTMKKALLQTSDPEARKAVLLQLSQKSDLPTKAKEYLATQLVQIPSGEANSYDSQTGSVVEMFEDLEKKMSDERGGGQNTEMEEKHTYDMMMLQLEGRMKESKQDRDKKAAAKAQAESDLGRATGEKAETQQAIAEDTKYLKELKAECAAKTAAYEERQATRKGELEAIGQATEILSGAAVSGGSAHLPSLVQKKAGTSFAQFRATVSSAAQSRVAAFLQERASTTRSQILAKMASRTAADPFAKVVKMIRDMITKLTEEANEEAEHKAFCDEELGANKATRDEKSETADSLRAQIEELTATGAKLADEIGLLNEGIQTLDKAAADAVDLRTNEKAKNEATIVDAKAASEATAQAISVLKDFYAKAAELVQTSSKGPTDGMMEDEGYSGSGGASSVMSMLEVVQSDFARLESETASSEQQAADEHSAFMAETAEDKQVKGTTLKETETRKQETAQALLETNESLKNNNDELTAANEYFDKLRPSCVDEGVSYEDRVARRKQEIESLHEAFNILDGTDVAV